MYLQKPRRNFRKPLENFTKTIGHPLMFNVCKYFFFTLTYYLTTSYKYYALVPFIQTKNLTFGKDLQNH